MKFRKKPVEVEAKSYDGTLHSAAKLSTWMDVFCAPYRIGIAGEDGITPFYVLTLEGEMLVSPGDWLIQGVQGEFYPCKPEIFAATYDEVED